MRISLACVLFVGLLCSATLQGAERRQDRCVVLISVDGLADFYFDDPRAEMPTIRELARTGARADGMICSFPTVTWPNHTTLVTGVDPAKHGVIGNNYLDRETGKPVPFIPDPLFDKSEIVKVPTIYDAAHQAGLKTSGIIWPATRNASSLDWTVPDMGGEDAWPNYGTASWLKELQEAGIPVDKHAAWVRESSGGVQRDWLYTRLFQHVMQHHAPNLVLIHLVEVDHVQHRYGPKTPEAYWSVSYADDRVRDIVEAARASRFGKETTIIVASDHGFYPIDREIRPNVLLKKLGESRQIKARAVSQGGACMVYLLEAEDRAEELESLRSALAGVEGVDSVHSREKFAALGQPVPENDSRAPDLWLSARSGYSFSDSDAGEEIVVPRSSPGGTHGYLPQQAALHATLIISGAGVRSGVTLPTVSNRDVAPTMARLLNVPFPSAEGRILTEALKDE